MNSVMHSFTSKDEWLNLRLNDVTSTEVSALFGCNPYMTEFELYHMKKNKQVVSLEPNERMTWGTRLEQAIAEGIAADRGWVIQKMDNYINNPDLRIGASFDYFGWGSKDDSPEPLNFIVEIKNVDYLQYKDKWIDDGINLEAPPHIELQVQQQMLLTGCEKAYICALISGNQTVVIERFKNEAIQNAIIKKVRKFWQDIESNVEPVPNLERDASFVISQFDEVEAGKIINADDEICSLANAYKSMTHLEAQAAKSKEIIKAKLLMKMQTAEKVKSELFTISTSNVAASEYVVKRKEYRSFRINFKKEKLDDNN